MSSSNHIYCNNSNSGQHLYCFLWEERRRAEDERKKEADEKRRREIVEGGEREIEKKKEENEVEKETSLIDQLVKIKSDLEHVLKRMPVKL